MERLIATLNDSYIHFIQMLLDDESQQRWFMSLSQLSENARTIELRNIAIKMHQAGEDDATVKMVGSLANDDVYAGIRAVLIAELNQK